VHTNNSSAFNNGTKEEMVTKDAQAVMLKQLKNPFDERFVKWRVGATNKDKTKGIALAYIDSREVTKRLDEVCGLGGWQSRLTRTDGGFISEIGILIDGEWIWKSNAAGDTKVEPIKGGASDAFKRAASVWGIGRYLYYLPNVWVGVVAQGNSFVLAELPELPDWAKHDTEIEHWEDVAELALDATASFDEQDVVTSVLTNLELIKNAASPDDLDKVVEQLTAEEQVGLASQINEKTKELLDATKSKPKATAKPNNS
jgi:hypothetical protein